MCFHIPVQSGKDYLTTLEVVANESQVHATTVFFFLLLLVLAFDAVITSHLGQITIYYGRSSRS